MSYDNYYAIPYNEGLIDSLTIYLPIEKIEIIDPHLMSDVFICYASTGEINNDEPLPPRPKIIENNGVKYRMNRVVFPPTKDTPQRTLIRLTITSKMLLEQYFQGINHENIEKIVDYINKANIIRFDVETALDSLCNDIDICINYNVLFEPYKEAIYYLKKRVIESKQSKVRIVSPKKKESLDKNYGLMFGNRDNGSVSNPFIKYYNKTEELLKNSVDFYNTYLWPQVKRGLDISNIVRKEVSIRNYTFKNSLVRKKLVDMENPMRTLRDILNITKEQLTKICNVQIKYYFRKRVIEISDDLSPTNKMFSFLMAKILELGGDMEEIMLGLNYIDCKVSRSKTKKRFEMVAHKTFNTDYLDELMKKNQRANDFIRLQKIWE